MTNVPNIVPMPATLETEPRKGWEVGARYRIWTGDVDEVLGFQGDWVYVRDVKTGRVRCHLTSNHDNKQVHCECLDWKCTCDCFTGNYPCEHGSAGTGC